MKDVQSILAFNDALLFSHKSTSIFSEANELINLGIEILNLSPCITNDINDQNKQKYLALKTNIHQIISIVKDFLTIAEQIAQMSGALKVDSKFYNLLRNEISDSNEINNQFLIDKINSLINYFKDSKTDFTKIIDILGLTLSKCKDQRDNTIFKCFIDLINSAELKNYGEEITECENNKYNNRILFEEEIKLISNNIKEHLEIVGNKKLELEIIISKSKFLEYTKKNNLLLVKNYESLIEAENKKTVENAQKIQEIKILDINVMQNRFQRLKSYNDSETNRINRFYENRREELGSYILLVSKEIADLSATKEKINNSSFYLIFCPYLQKSLSNVNSSISKLETQINEINYQLSRSVFHQKESLNDLKREYDKIHQSIQKELELKSEFEKKNLNNIKDRELKSIENLEKNRQETLNEISKYDNEIGKLKMNETIIKNEINLEEGLIKTLGETRDEKYINLEERNLFFKNKIDDLKSKIDAKLCETGHLNTDVALKFAASLANFIHKSSLFTIKIDSFLQFCICYKSVMNFEEKYLEEAFKIEVIIMDHCFDFSELIEWAIAAFPNNKDFQNVIQEDYSMKEIVDILNSNEDNVIKEKLCLKNNIQLKSVKKGIDSLFFFYKWLKY